MVEFYKKWGDQIEAIELVAQANQRVAEVLEERAHLADFVIDLIKEISCLKQQFQIPCSGINGITLNNLVSPLAQQAFFALGFTDPQLQKLCELVMPRPEETSCVPVGPLDVSQPIVNQDLKATSRVEPKSPPPTSPRRRKASAKKR